MFLVAEIQGGPMACVSGLAAIACHMVVEVPLQYSSRPESRNEPYPRIYIQASTRGLNN